MAHIHSESTSFEMKMRMHNWQLNIEYLYSLCQPNANGTPRKWHAISSIMAALFHFMLLSENGFANAARIPHAQTHKFTLYAVT